MSIKTFQAAVPTAAQAAAGTIVAAMQLLDAAIVNFLGTYYAQIWANPAAGPQAVYNALADANGNYAKGFNSINTALQSIAVGTDAAFVAPIPPGTVTPNANGTVTVTLLPDLGLSVAHSGPFKLGDTAAAADTLSITVGNVGLAATTGTVTVTDVLPTGITPGAIGGTGWTSTTSGQTVTATRADALASFQSYPALTIIVSVAGNAAVGSASATATVAGGGDVNAANNTIADFLTIA